MIQTPQALNNVCTIFLSQFPTSCIKGEIVVQILEEVYLVGKEECKKHFHGRIILAKGDKPLTHLGVHRGLFPLEKGFMSFPLIPLRI